MNIPIEKILPNPEQPRRHFDEATLNELAQSIEALGVIQPVVVEQADESYILHDGERRLRAAKLAGLAEIPAVVVPGANGAGGQERLLRALVANLQRADLSPPEEGEAFGRLHAMGMSNAAIAHMVGKSTTYIASRRALLDLEPEIQDLVAAKLLPVDQRAVLAIRSVPADARVEFARKLARPGLAIKTVQESAKKLNAALSARRTSQEPAVYHAHRKAGKPNLPNWDALRQLGKLPPWKMVVGAANHTCATCVLRPEASAAICGNCPAVAMLARMIEASNE